MLYFIYKERETNSEKIFEASGFDEDLIIECLEYLQESGLIKVGFKALSGDWDAIRCTPTGIEIIETPEDRKSPYGVHFNLTINVDSIFKTDAIFKGSLLG